MNIIVNLSNLGEIVPWVLMKNDDFEVMENHPL